MNDSTDLATGTDTQEPTQVELGATGPNSMGIHPNVICPEPIYAYQWARGPDDDQEVITIVSLRNVDDHRQVLEMGEWGDEVENRRGQGNGKSQRDLTTGGWGEKAHSSCA